MNGSLRFEILFPCEPNLRLKPVIRSNLFPRLRLVVIGVGGSSRSCSQSVGVVKVSGFQFWPKLKDADSSPPKKKRKNVHMYDEEQSRLSCTSPDPKN